MINADILTYAGIGFYLTEDVYRICFIISYMLEINYYI